MSQAKRRRRFDFVKLLISLALAAGILLLYCTSYDHPFIGFADPQYVNDEHVQSGLSAAGVRWAFTTFATGNWHPFTWFSLQLDYDLYGRYPGFYHVTNAVLHTANTILLFLVLCEL